MDDEYDPEYEAEVMQGSVNEFSQRVVGEKIVAVERRDVEFDEDGYVGYGRPKETVFTLSNGHQVILGDTEDCCAFTEVEDFEFLTLTDHAITRVETDEGFQDWFIYAESVPVVNLKVAWSPGNPYYYGFGFTVRVKENNGD